MTSPSQYFDKEIFPRAETINGKKVNWEPAYKFGFKNLFLSQNSELNLESCSSWDIKY